MSDFIEIPFFDDENMITSTRTLFIAKSYFKGSPFGRPFAVKCVSYVDAEASRSGTYDDRETGKIIKFKCDGCKKVFKAERARAIRFQSHFNTFERAYCGNCYRKASKLTEQIHQALRDFDESMNQKGE